eukprot:COSAG02_NODE_5043_length_4701_cov_3.161886_2_plen_531_part_00
MRPKLTFLMKMLVVNADFGVGLPGVTSTHVHTRDFVGMPSTHEVDFSATLELPVHGMESSILGDQSSSDHDKMSPRLANVADGTPRRSGTPTRYISKKKAAARSPAATRSRKPKQRVVGEQHIAALKHRLQTMHNDNIDGGARNVTEIFKWYDADNDGSLSLVEFTTAVRDGGKIPSVMMTDSDVQQLFDLVDTDESGEISIEELVAFVWAEKPTRTMERKQKSLAGKTERAQVNMLKKRLQSMAMSTVGGTGAIIDPEEIFRRYDKDTSGALDLSEFTTAVRKGGKIPPASMTDGDLRQLFNAIDTDSSGCINIEELVAFVWGSEGVPTRTNGRRPQPVRKTKPKDESSAQVNMLKKRLQSMAMSTVGGTGAIIDPEEIFRRYDKDTSGALDLSEFTTAVRKGGKIPPASMTDGDLRQLFNSIDTDSSGCINIEELVAFVWGSEGAPSAPIEAAARRSRQAEKDHKAAMALAAASEATIKKQDLRRLKNQLQSLGYRAGKSDPTKLFAGFDLDHSGRLVSSKTPRSCSF